VYDSTLGSRAIKKKKKKRRRMDSMAFKSEALLFAMLSTCPEREDFK